MAQASDAKPGEAAKGAEAVDFDVLERLVDVVTRGGVVADSEMSYVSKKFIIQRRSVLPAW